MTKAYVFDITISVISNIETYNSDLSQMSMYGNPTLFKELGDRGYTDIAFGKSDWKDGKRVSVAFALFHPTGKVVSVETIKLDDGEHTIQAGQETHRFKRLKGFEKHLEKAQLSMGERHPLGAVLEQLNSTTGPETHK